MKNIVNQMRFWVILGPMVMLASFLVLFLKLSFPFVLIPLVACATLFLCWRYKLAGLAISVALLVVSLTYYYFHISADDRFWLVGMGMAFAVSCLVTALCSEETETLLKGMQLESESRLEHLRRMDDKLKMTKKAAKYEYEDVKGQLTRAYNQLAEKEGKVDAQEEVIAILREELQMMRDRFSKTGVEPRVVEEMKEQVENLTREKELLQVTLSKLQKELKGSIVSKV